MTNTVTELVSYDPSTEREVWRGNISTEVQIHDVIRLAKDSQREFDALGLEKRKEIIQRFAQVVKENIDVVARVISEENGKPLWESRTEVNSLMTKVQASFDSYAERATPKRKEMAAGKVSVTRFRPHGVMVVLGPFNFPMSMPNSHIMPALLAGNAVIFKPSERTPKSAETYMELWQRAGLPRGVLQVVHGGSEIGRFLITHPETDGVLFIGSRHVGVEINKAIAQDTGKICALEMGGNSPLIIWDYKDVRAAIHIAIQSAYISSGQRCSAARRLIVNNNIHSEFIPLLASAVSSIVVGKACDLDPVPFMGPLIDQRAVKQFISDYEELLKKGGKAIVATRILIETGNNFVTPALVDVTGVQTDDKEIFGPLLQVSFADTLDQAITIANATQFGLAAGIVTQSRDNYESFFSKTKAGIINWNQPLTGATTIAPFGGVKASGNNRSAGYLSVDYCSYPCASIEDESGEVPATLSPGVHY